MQDVILFQFQLLLQPYPRRLYTGRVDVHLAGDLLGGQVHPDVGAMPEVLAREVGKVGFEPVEETMVHLVEVHFENVPVFVQVQVPVDGLLQHFEGFLLPVQFAKRPTFLVQPVGIDVVESPSYWPMDPNMFACRFKSSGMMT